MADPSPPDPRRQQPLEIDVQPTVAGRVARWMERGRIMRSQVEAARARHASVDLAFDLVEHDSSIGGALLAGALAYRLFVFLLPTSLLLVSGLGLYADTVDQSPGKVARDAGLHGLIASEIASTASGRNRGLVFIAMIPAVLYASYTLFRAIAKVYAIVWLGSGRGVRVTPKGFCVFLGVLAAQIAMVVFLGWIRHDDRLGGLVGLLVYLVLAGGVWLVASLYLPRRDLSWWRLLPGCAMFGIGLFLVNVFNVYITTRIVEGRANTYGALGVATALLFSLVLVGRVIIFSGELNAALDARRTRGQEVDDAVPAKGD
jgi:uncharacterized BrkB/YihY/UPF0761 family membrane protein